VLRSESTKFRTVRGSTIGLIVALLLTVTFALVVANGEHEGGCTGAPPAGSNSPGTGCYTGHPFIPTGPDGTAVADSYELYGRLLSGNGTLTVRIASLSGLTFAGSANQAPSLAHTRSALAPWAKAGILITPSTKQGSTYAAVMATGVHGVRFQYNYGHDAAPQTTSGSKLSPVWLRLTRTGDAIESFESSDGATWSPVATTHLPSLPNNVTIGLFVTSPASVHGTATLVPTQATATFDHLSLTGAAIQQQWASRSIGTGADDFYPILGTGSTKRSGAEVTISGSGDIATAVNPLVGGSTASDTLWFGLLIALIVVIVTATSFITVEYRRGLMRTTFAATPRRGSVLAAKTIVIAAVAFIVGGVAAAIATPFSNEILVANGNFVFPQTILTTGQTIVGAGALLALTAVTVLALGAILRSAAVGVAAGIVVFVLPYILGNFLTGPAQEWIFRLTPAAGFAMFGTAPRSSLVESAYTFANGYYPLPAWGGFGVLCVYAAVASIAALLVVRRRDA
jgi:hypothetical protein